MSQLNILIIDDNQDLADGLAMVLEDEGYQVKLAYNGRDGISIFNIGYFDIVFLDIKLPDMNGIEVFQNIHKINPKTKTIMMSAYRIEQIASQLTDNENVKILRKPFENEYVLKVLQEIDKESILLMINDGDDLSKSLSSYLTEQGVKTLYASNENQAVEAVLANPLDVLILDLKLPIIRALEVYMQLKQQNSAVTTIIIVENTGEASDILRSTSITGCLFKPFSPDKMLNTIKQMSSC